MGKEAIYKEVVKGLHITEGQKARVNNHRT